MTNIEMKETATQIIISDMKAAGFEAREDLNGNALVGLNRTIGLAEVHDAMDEAGYERCQYRASRTCDPTAIEIAAIVG